MKKVSLSIAMPMYNHEKTIRATLDSITSQINDIKDICNLEIVIADNCSTDNSANIIKNEYLPKYPNIIKYYRNETNIGMSKNFNRAVELSNNDYVWFFGDDYLHPDSLRVVVSKILKKKNPSLIFLCANSSCDISKKPIKIIAEEKVSNKDFLFDNIYDLSKFSKYNNKDNYYISVLNPLFISIVIFKKNDWVYNYTDDDSKSIFPHLYPIFRIGKKNNILILNSNFVANQGGSFDGRENVEFKFSVSYSYLESFNDIFGDCAILSDLDRKRFLNHFSGLLLKYRKKITKYDFLDVIINKKILPLWINFIINLTYKICSQKVTTEILVMLIKIRREVLRIFR
jgi:glycosyltransferase involved in cell wall biosynthesis